MYLVMMKKGVNICLVLICVFAFASLNSSEAFKIQNSTKYRVIKVNGKIYFVKSGIGMKTGDYFIEGTPLEFSTLKDKAAAFNKERGRFIIQPNIKGKAKVLPATSNIATRSPDVFNNFLDLKQYFSGHCLFIGKNRIEA